jgi:hypothetical protein
VDATPSWPRRAAVVPGLAAVAALALALFLDGRLPAPVPRPAADYSPALLLEALAQVDSLGRVDFDALKARPQALRAYVASLASVSPRTQPERFPTPEDSVAYWLNAYHALVLQQLVDAWPVASPDEVSFFTRRAWPIGGQRLSLAAIERRYLAQAMDARVHLARFDGSAGGPLLDGAPFDGATLDAQLNDAARRFLRRPENVALDGEVVRLHPVLRDEAAAFRAALPDGQGSVLQVVWAFLPDTCDGERPGCDTRADLDKACGPALEACTLAFVAPTRWVAAKGGNR